MTSKLTGSRYSSVRAPNPRAKAKSVQIQFTPGAVNETRTNSTRSPEPRRANRTAGAQPSVQPLSSSSAPKNRKEALVVARLVAPLIPINKNTTEQRICVPMNQTEACFDAASEEFLGSPPVV